jgi:hypothetical protein
MLQLQDANPMSYSTQLQRQAQVFRFFHQQINWPRPFSSQVARMLAKRESFQTWMISSIRRMLIATSGSPIFLSGTMLIDIILMYISSSCW